MAKLFLVRHGETDWNKDHKLMGITDVPLNENGRKQAENVAREVCDMKFDAIFSSPLKRALETAEIIKKSTGYDIQISNLLLERDFGILAGKNWSEIETIIPNAREIDRKQEYDYSKYGGETANQVRERIEKFITELKGKKYESGLVVCHGGVIRMLELMKGDARQTIPTASLTEFEI